MQASPSLSRISLARQAVTNVLLIGTACICLFLFLCLAPRGWDSNMDDYDEHSPS